MFPRLIRGKRDDHKKITERKEFFLDNGAAVLEQVIRTFNGDCNPIRSYSAEELDNATGHFQREIHRDWDYIMYKGIHQDREIAVKKFVLSDYRSKDGQLETVANEIAIASRMSSHKNVLKLLGCCLGTELPILVYEFPANGNLETCIFFNNDVHQRRLKLPWEHKLKIVTETASALAYLHQGLSKTVVFRDIKPTNVFLDENHTAKLFHFQLAMAIPEGETHVDGVFYGTVGFLAPEAVMNGRFSEKTDVYGFGVLLLEVLTGMTIGGLFHWYSNIGHKSGSKSSGESDSSSGKVLEEYCKIFLRDESNRDQLMEFSKLAQRCLEANSDDRPNMMDVTPVIVTR